MLKPLFLSCGLLLSCLAVSAQHCPFDNMATIVVEVYDSLSEEQIYDLELFLKQADGEPAAWGEDTLFFVQNAASTGNWRHGKFEKIRYAFAKDHYILPLSMSWKKKELFLHIHDSSGTYPDKVLPLPKEAYFDVHKHISIPWYEIGEGVSFTVAPGSFQHLMEVGLVPKKD